MTKALHHNHANGQWFKLSLAEQLSNVGSEFSRMLRSKKNNKEKRFNPALNRFLELINLTLSDPRWSLSKKREIARLKENILDNIYGDSEKLTTIEPLERYFYYFGVARQIESLNS